MKKPEKGPAPTDYWMRKQRRDFYDRARRHVAITADTVKFIVWEAWWREDLKRRGKKP